MSPTSSSDTASTTPGALPALPARVAVLGGTGLIGSAVTRAFLDAGSDVVVVARHPPSRCVAPLLAGAELRIGDARDATVVSRVVSEVEHLVNALGVPHPAQSVRDPLAQFDAEIPVLLGLLAALGARGDVGLTYVSSGGAIYGNDVMQPTNEEAPCHPVSPYGITKLAAERYVLMAAANDGLDARILRVANAYGAVQRPATGQGLIAACLHAAATRSTVRIFGDGTSVRDFIDARDVARATVALAGSQDRTAVVNVATGVGHRLTDVIELVRTVTGANLQVVHEPRRSSDVRTVVLDVARLSRSVPWRPIPLAQGIRDAWTIWAQCGLDGVDVRAEKG